MRLNPPKKVRQLIYVVTAVGTPVVAYLLVKGVIGEAEVVFWGALSTVVNGMAALNASN